MIPPDTRLAPPVHSYIPKVWAAPTSRTEQPHLGSAGTGTPPLAEHKPTQEQPRRVSSCAPES